EYQRGVSAWNFDVEDLKLQASMLLDEDEIRQIKEEEDSQKITTSEKRSIKIIVFCWEKTNGNDVPVVESPMNKGNVSKRDLTEYDNEEKKELKKSESKAELPPMVDKDKEAALAKTRNQTGRPRETQSGPIMPGAMLSHSMSDRARNTE
ncbi:hypothetical protein MIMGU_mgv1a0199023mg, partial [Erythranthe guttata]